MLKTHTDLDATAAPRSGPTTYALVRRVPEPGRARPRRRSRRCTAPRPAAPAIHIADPAGDRIVNAVIGGDGTVSIRDRHTDGAIRVRYADAKARARPARRAVGLEPRCRDRSGCAPARPARISSPRARATGSAPTASPFTPRARRRRVPDHAAPWHDPRPVHRRRRRDPARRHRELRAGRRSRAPTATALPSAPGPASSGRGCDVDRDRLTPHWEVVAAPPGSASGAAAEHRAGHPTLLVDAAGPYRVRLTVTDSRRRHEPQLRGRDLRRPPVHRRSPDLERPALR